MSQIHRRRSRSTAVSLLSDNDDMVEMLDADDLCPDDADMV
jgi:hypothetical protein